MVVQIKNLQIHGCKVGISMAKGSAVTFEIDDFSATNTETAILERDAPSIREKLGLPIGTDPELIIEAVGILRSSATQQEAVGRMRESGLAKFLGVAADISQVVTSLIPFAGKIPWGG